MKRLLLLILLSASLCFGQSRITNTGIEVIKHYESFRAKSYLCPSSVWTIGFGSTEGIRPNMTITLDKAVILLKKDITRFEQHVSGKTTRILKWNEFDALVSFSFNVGYQIKGSLRTAVNNGNTKLAVFYMKKYNRGRAKGVLTVLPGLVKRRKTEGILYESGKLVF